ncbi:hypothetical protein A2U01_0083917, partial [Trifolium medium]|nr:hypothetical protein [Trifolium medium]
MDLFSARGAKEPARGAGLEIKWKELRLAARGAGL